MSESIPASFFSGGFSENGNHCQWACYGSMGGISSGKYRQANIGLSVGDDTFAVDWNRQRVKENIQAGFLVSGKQTHGINIFSLNEPLAADFEVDDCDGFITNQPNIALMIQQADCQAVLFFDPVRKVVGAVHSGWRGSVQNIIGEIVMKMKNDFGSKASDMYALISPSLGPCCAEFINHEKELPPGFKKFMIEKNHFDFWQISRKQLMDGGVYQDHIQTIDVCTSCDERFFSYRRACREGDGVTGRQCSLIMLEN